MGLNEDGYYDLKEILGYNAIVNIVLSDRGRGKSWGTKHFLMRQPGTFMCLYRQKPDMMSAIACWTDPLVESGEYVAENFEWDGNAEEGITLKYNGVIKGYFRYLTQVNHIKQEVFPDDLNWVWWDEFIPLVYKKLPGVESEGDALRAIMKTIEHDTVHSREEKGLKPLRVLLFANPFTWNNPVLSYFKVRPKYGVHRVGPGIVCELLPPAEPIKRGRKMTMDEFLGDEVNRNQGFLEQNAFVVDRRPKGLVPYMSVRFGKDYFVISRYPSMSKFYVEKKRSHGKATEFVSLSGTFEGIYGTLDGLKENEMCIEHTALLDRLRTWSYTGRMFFPDLNTKFDFLNNL